MEHYAILIAAIVLGLVGIAHLARLFVPFPVIIGSYHFPRYLSGIVGVIAIVVSYYLFRLV